MKTSTIFASCFCAVGTAACIDTSTTTTLQIQIQGSGVVYSDSGDIDCSGAASGQSGSCTFSQRVGVNDDASSVTFHLHAVPAAGGALDTWGLAVDVDCPNCNSDDPEMGAIQTNGADADVRIDMNPGYDVTDIVTVSFLPGPTTS